jgi:CBS domain-containing protein
VARRCLIKKVRDILDVKGRQVWSIAPGASVFDALKLMAEKQVGALMVLEESKVVGIMSERDYARKVVLHAVLRRRHSLARS